MNKRSMLQVDETHPANAALLRYLRGGALGDGESGPPESFDDPYYNLWTHPETVARLWDEITTQLPQPCRWVVAARPALLRPDSGVIFGVAQGTHTYALRLPAAEREQAEIAARERAERYATEFGLTGEQRDRYLTIHTGPVWTYSDGSVLDLREIGPEWVFGRALDGEIGWCLAAYHHAR